MEMASHDSMLCISEVGKHGEGCLPHGRQEAGRVRLCASVSALLYFLFLCSGL